MGRRAGLVRGRRRERPEASATLWLLDSAPAMVGIPTQDCVRIRRGRGDVGRPPC